MTKREQYQGFRDIGISHEEACRRSQVRDRHHKYHLRKAWEAQKADLAILAPPTSTDPTERRSCLESPPSESDPSQVHANRGVKSQVISSHPTPHAQPTPRCPICAGNPAYCAHAAYIPAAFSPVPDPPVIEAPAIDPRLDPQNITQNPFGLSKDEARTNEFWWGVHDRQAQAEEAAERESLIAQARARGTLR